MPKQIASIHTLIAAAFVLFASMAVAATDCGTSFPSVEETKRTKFNFVFPNISLDAALRLLGDIANVKVLRPTYVNWTYAVKTDYWQVEWIDILNRICESQKLTCWVEADTLYAMPESDTQFAAATRPSCGPES